MRARAGHHCPCSRRGMGERHRVGDTATDGGVWSHPASPRLGVRRGHPHTCPYRCTCVTAVQARTLALSRLHPVGGCATSCY